MLWFDAANRSPQPSTACHTWLSYMEGVESFIDPFERACSSVGWGMFGSGCASVLGTFEWLDCAEVFPDSL